MPRIWRSRIPLDKYHRDNKGFMRGDRPCTKLLVHYVFTPKFRADLSQYPGLINVIRIYIGDVCEDRKWPIDELAVEKDHVHLLVQIPPSVSVSYVAQIIKGNVSKRLRELYPELRNLHKKSFWGRHFFATTVGSANIEVIENYIGNQGVHLSGGL